MLQVSEHQMDQLGAVQTARFILDSVGSLREAYPSETALETELELKTRVVRYVEQLRKFGIANSGDLSRGLHLLYVLQHMHKRPEMPQEIVALLQSDKVAVETKLEAIEQLILFGEG
jgi:hypothetical protein